MISTKKLLKIQNPALREGIVFGVVIGALLILVPFLQYLGTDAYTIGYYVILIGGYAWAAMRAAKETMRVRTGILAAIIAGVIANLITLVIEMVSVIINIDAIRIALIKQATTAADRAITNQDIITSVVINSIVSLIILGVAAGAIFGWGGALVGTRKRYGQVSSLAVPVDEEEVVESEQVVEADQPVTSRKSTRSARNRSTRTRKNIIDSSSDASAETEEVVDQEQAGVEEEKSETVSPASKKPQYRKFLDNTPQ